MIKRSTIIKSSGLINPIGVNAIPDIYRAVRFGSRTVEPGTMGLSQERNWSMKRENKTPSYTTEWPNSGVSLRRDIKSESLDFGITIKESILRVDSGSHHILLIE